MTGQRLLSLAGALVATVLAGCERSPCAGLANELDPHSPGWVAWLTSGEKPGSVRAVYRNNTDRFCQVKKLAVSWEGFALDVSDTLGREILPGPPPTPPAENTDKFFNEEVDIPPGGSLTKDYEHLRVHGPPVRAGLGPGRYCVRVRLAGWRSNALDLRVR